MVSGDRTLHYFHVNARQFVADIVAVGFEDLEELNRKIQGLRAEIDQLELRACAIAGERADRISREEREVSTPTPWA